MHLAVGFIIAILLVMNPSARAADVLENERLRAVVGPDGLTSITDKTAGGTAAAITGDGFTSAVDALTFDSSNLAPKIRSETPTTRSYTFLSNGWRIRVIYELRHGWHFLSKHLELTPPANGLIHLKRLEPFRATIGGEIAEDQPVKGAAFVRFKEAGGRGVLLAIQNPFLQWKRDGEKVSLAYEPDIDWQRADDSFESDRV